VFALEYDVLVHLEIAKADLNDVLYLGHVDHML
jgi:hypothetical protein